MFLFPLLFLVRVDSLVERNVDGLNRRNIVEPAVNIRQHVILYRETNTHKKHTYTHTYRCTRRILRVSEYCMSKSWSVGISMLRSSDRACVCVCVCVCAQMCEWVRVCASVYVCVYPGHRWIIFELITGNIKRSDSHAAQILQTSTQPIQTYTKQQSNTTHSSMHTHAHGQGVQVKMGMLLIPFSIHVVVSIVLLLVCFCVHVYVYRCVALVYQ
jgi:hypothetical protein